MPTFVSSSCTQIKPLFRLKINSHSQRKPLNSCPFDQFDHTRVQLFSHARWPNHCGYTTKHYVKDNSSRLFLTPFYSPLMRFAGTSAGTFYFVTGVVTVSSF